MTEQYPVYVIVVDNIHQLYEDIFRKWCEENCKGSFIIDRHSYSKYDNSRNEITITFEAEEEAAGFKLRWL